MPVVIFHGDNSLLIQQKIDEMKKSYPADAIERASLKSETFDQIIMRLSTPSFFSDQRLFVIEEADEKKVDTKKLIPESNITVVFSFAKDLSASSEILKWAGAHNYRTVNLSQIQDKRIFTFLDLLAEKDKKGFAMIDDLVDDFGGVYILTMMIFLLRRLVLPSGNVPAFIESKIKKQKKNFSDLILRDLYKQVLITDFQIKTGKVEDKTGILLLVNSFFN